jgi:predicted Fe-Mo cluster-binding NifX family protein
MKIAVASTDGVLISQHFGRSKCFIIFEAADGKVTGREVRDNTYTPHALGQCHEGEGEQHHDQPHSHADVIAALHDCQVLLCGGMGWRAAEDLKSNGIQALVIRLPTTPEQAVQRYLDGTLKAASGFCRCHE